MTPEDELVARIAGTIASGLVGPVEIADDYSKYAPSEWDEVVTDISVSLARAIVARIKERK